MQALATALIGGAQVLSGQSRNKPDRTKREDTSSAALAFSQSPEALEAARENADQERWNNILSQPAVLSLLVLILGLFASNKIHFSDDKTQNALMQSTLMSGSVLIALGNAGVGDLTSAGVAGTLGVSNILNNLDLGNKMKEELGSDWYKWLVSPLWGMLT